MNPLYVQILYSILVATVYGLARYFQQHTKEQFDAKLLVKTLVIGAVVGFVQYQFGWTYDQALTWVIGNAAITTFIDQIIDRLFNLKGSGKKGEFPADVKKVDEIRQIALDDLHRKPNVTLVGIGTKVIGGVDTGEPCIKVFVSNKVAAAELSPTDLIPPTITYKDFTAKTDVEVKGPWEGVAFIPLAAIDHQKKWRPMLAGVSISRTVQGTGSMGGNWYKDLRDDKVADISNNHVVAGVYDGNPEDNKGVTIINPGVADGGTTDEQFRIGIGKRCVPLKTVPIQGGAPPKDKWNYVDLGIYEETVPHEKAALGPNLGRIRPNGFRRVEIADVQKKTKGINSGRTLGVTYGHPAAVNSSFYVQYGAGRFCFFSDCVVWTKDPPSEKFIAPGHSGSDVFIDYTTEKADPGAPVFIEGKWAGLIFAGDQYGNGITCQPDNILRIGELGFDMGETLPPPPPPSDIEMVRLYIDGLLSGEKVTPDSGTEYDFTLSHVPLGDHIVYASARYKGQWTNSESVPFKVIEIPTPPPTEKVIVAVTSPTPNQEIPYGSTITFKVNAKVEKS